MRLLTYLNRISGLLLLACGTVAADGANERPNILFIFADDLSYEAVGSAGIVDVDTPHLDQLADAGTRFTHAYNMGAWGGAVCVASRTMLNTGRFIWDARQTNLEEYGRENRMWAQRLSQAGYRTYFSGKWHVPTDVTPLFDVVRNVRAGMPDQTPAGYDRPKDEADYAAGWKPWDTQNGGYWEGGRHWSEVLADDGVEFLKQAAADEHPFFMYLAFNAPHDPRQSPKAYVDRYPLERVALPGNFMAEYPYKTEIGCGETLRDERLAPFPRTEYSVKVNRQEYFALITHTDDQIGRILEALKETGLADNTYIFFTADHGLAVGHHGLIGKQNMYEHSVRVPFFVVGPGVEAGAQINVPIYLQDVVPTSLQLAGAESQGIAFESLVPLLNGDAAVHYDSIYGAYKGLQRMISKNGWKLIYYPTIGVERLYNTNADPFEQNDLAGNPDCANKLMDLRAGLRELSTSLGDELAYE